MLYASASLLVSYVLGVPLMLRPLAAAAALATVEFFLSREIAWSPPPPSEKGRKK
jgi:hypothetical protein